MNAVAKGHLQMMEEKTHLDERAKKRLSKSLVCLDDISELIEKVKKIQRIDGSDDRRELVDLSWIIEDAVQSHNLVPGRKVTINYEPQLKRMVLASGLITDVFTNLIANSIKHSKGPVTIDIVLSKVFYEGREYYLVSVEDDGPGIPDDVKKRIFIRLQRGRTTATGSGLGLFLVRRLVEDYHGRVWVEDRVPGDHTKGARFVVLLPVATTPDAEH
jgi:signal transduction histidine kinase